MSTMSKEMTPMKRFSTNMQVLRSSLKPYFSEVTLNKSEPKYNSGYGESSYSAGVENDFIIIFAEKKKNISFALAFNYLGLEVSKQNVVASVKNGKSNDDIVSSLPMDLATFKDTINSFNKWIADFSGSTRTSFQIVDQFSEFFLQKKMDIKAEVQKKEKEIDQFIIEKTKDLNIPQLKQDDVKAKHSVEKTKEVIRKTIAETPEFIELEQIKKRATYLQNVVTLQENKLKKDLNLKAQEQKSSDSEDNLRFAQSMLESSVNDLLSQSSKVISSRVKKKF